MSKRRFKKMLEIGIIQFKDPYYQEFAAQLAFYLLMSVIPIVGLTSYALGFFNITGDILSDFIDKYIGTGTGDYIKMFLQQAPSTGFSIVMIVVALWSASKAQFAMARIMNYTFSGGKTTGAYVYERARALITVLILIVGILLALIVLVYGQHMIEVIVSHQFPGVDVAKMWLLVRWPIAIILYFLLIAINYYLLPSKGPKFREVIPGAIFASTGFLLVSYGYSIYMKYISNQSVLYGSFATIVGLLLWFWIISWVIWLGTLINKCFIDSKEYI